MNPIHSFSFWGFLIPFASLAAIDVLTNNSVGVNLTGELIQSLIL